MKDEGIEILSKEQSFVLPEILNHLHKPLCGVVHFSDVFTERAVDFDVELSAILRNVGIFSDMTFPIGVDPQRGDYGAVLVDDLMHDRRRIAQIARNVAPENHPDVERLTVEAEYSIATILNCAPRNAQTTMGGKNGEDFYLAVTKHGVEVFVTPLNLLSSLELRSRILALYRIPSAQHPFFDGAREQFRSSIITTSRLVPKILQPVYQYATHEELVEAKANGTHPSVIPLQTNYAQVVYIDRFGNVRLSVSDMKRFLEKMEDVGHGNYGGLKIGNSEAIPVFIATSLSDIPEGEYGVYCNVSDLDDGNAGYIEFAKKSPDCVHEKWPAASAVAGLSRNFRSEEVMLVDTPTISGISELGAIPTFDWSILAT